MNLDLMVAIRDDRTLPTGYYKSILYALASRGDKAYPNQSQLMRDSGIGSRNTLVKMLQELEDLGWLKITKSRHGKNKYWNNRYQVVVPDLIHDVVKYDEPLVKSDTLKINKEKVKVKAVIKENKSRDGWNHSSISDWLSPVSGVYKGVEND